MKHRHLTIKIDLEREAKRIKHGTSYKDKFWYIDVINGKTMRSGGVAFAEKATGNNGRDLRKILRRIKETLYL